MTNIVRNWNKTFFSYNLRRNNNYKNYAIRTESFSHSYFPYCVREWNQLDPQIKSQPSVVSLFKNKLIALIQPNKRSVYKVVDLKGVQLLTRLRVNFCDLREHRFQYNFLSPQFVCATRTYQCVSPKILIVQ